MKNLSIKMQVQNSEIIKYNQHLRHLRLIAARKDDVFNKVAIKIDNTIKLKVSSKSRQKSTACQS